MRSFNKMIVIFFLSSCLLFSTNVAYAQSDSEWLNQKQTEKQDIAKELKEVQENLNLIENNLSTKKKDITTIENNIKQTKEEIEKKKEEIVVLEDKVLARKEILEERAVSLQQTDHVNFILQVIFNANSLSDLLERANAATTVVNADKDLLEEQRRDLRQIEKEKKAIDQKENDLQHQYDALVERQGKLEKQLQEKQKTLAEVKEKYDAISNEIALAQRTSFDKQLGSLEKSLASGKSGAPAVKPSSSANKAYKGKELYVVATAYSHKDSKTGKTAVGYNIKKNKNMKLIAVDPSVIPLGTKVWVEGYGEAIAGDTGGAIKGHKIDVLMPSNSKAKKWGRRTVKVIILD